MSFSATASATGTAATATATERVTHRRRSRISVSVAASRRTVQPGRTTTVVSYSSTSIGPGSGAAPIDARVRTGASTGSPPNDAVARARPLGRLLVERRGRSTALDGPERGQPQRADHDRRARLAAHAVQPLVLVLERGDQRRQVERAGAQLDLDLPRLAAVAQLGAAQPLDLACRRPPARAAPRARRTPRRARRGRHGARVEVARVHVVELRPGEQQPERAETAPRARARAPSGSRAPRRARPRAPGPAPP